MNTVKANERGLPEYLMQGKHYASTQGRGHFADDEVLDLNGMYAAAHRPRSVKALLEKVGILLAWQDVAVGHEVR